MLCSCSLDVRVFFPGFGGGDEGISDVDGASEELAGGALACLRFLGAWVSALTPKVSWTLLRGYSF